MVEEPPTDYSLQYQEREEAEVNSANPVSNIATHDIDNVESVTSYFTEGTPFDTPRGISNAGSLTDLKGQVEDDLEANEPQLYATEGTPGCYSRGDSESEDDRLVLLDFED